jgi:tetratricopeptide (TPR) repeat protein
VISLKSSAALPRQALDGLGDSASPAPLAQPPAQDRRNGAKSSSKSQARQRKALSQLKTGLHALTQKDYVTASTNIQQALEVDKGNPLAWRMLAFAFERQGEYPKAFAAYESAARLAPDNVALIRDVGRLAYRLGTLDLARRLFERFLASEPGDEEATTSLACVLRDQNLYDDAIALLRDVINISPERPVLWNTLGTVLSDSGDTASAIIYYDEALRLDPGFHKARQNRAYCLTALGQPEKAIEEMDIALEGLTDPHEISITRLTKAFTQLLIGDLAGGFEGYEARFEASADGAVQFTEFGKRWTPEDDLSGKTLLIYAEQGLGDEVMFANVVNDALDAIGADGRLFIAVERRLVTLFQRSFPRAVVVAHKSVRRFDTLFRTVDLGDPHPRIDLWTPLASLFRRFRTTLASFPRDRAFLVPDPERVAHWRRLLEESGPGPYVGVLWKSMNMGGARQRHYSPFTLWSPVLEKPGVRFVNLQYADAEEDLAAARARGLDIWTPPGIDLKMDLDDLAALCSALDAVMGPSTATTNLAGAVGARVFLSASPGWWTGFGSDQAPCYPSARVFHARQFGEWEPVMQQMADALDRELLCDRHEAQIAV